jgi:site-specific DNA-methyltransferase (adenine-specific)
LRNEAALPVRSVHFSSATDEWATPLDTYRALDAEFHFTYDPCPLASDDGLNVDGLASDWGDVTFCNPPYSDIARWVKKAWAESQQGKTVVLLIPSRTDTRWWHDYCMKGAEIRFIKGRLRFGSATTSAPFPSCVVIFRTALPDA